MQQVSKGDAVATASEVDADYRHVPGKATKAETGITMTKSDVSTAKLKSVPKHRLH